jgi:hypothetical protein
VFYGADLQKSEGEPLELGFNGIFWGLNRIDFFGILEICKPPNLKINPI